MHDDPKHNTPPQPPTRNEIEPIMRRLQGEDGYEVFNDRPADDRDRWLREYEENRR
ncbi:MAG TPA: hypothetical protein VGL77_02585 [Armatimonadota bacterium]|jgi:hypothetical protein